MLLMVKTSRTNLIIRGKPLQNLVIPDNCYIHFEVRHLLEIATTKGLNVSV